MDTSSPVLHSSSLDAIYNDAECERPNWLAIVGIVLLLTFICSACSSPPGPPKYLLAINRNGQPVKTDVSRYPVMGSNEYLDHLHVIFDGMTNYANNRIPRPLVAGETNSAPAMTNRLVIFIHGGMNSTKDGIKRAAALHQTILDDNYYPIFLSWDSDLCSSWWEHTWAVRRGNKDYASLAWLLTPFYLISDIGGAVLKSPIVFIEGFWRTGEALTFKTFENTAFANAQTASLNLTNDYRTNRINAIAVDIGTNSLTSFGNGKQVTYTLLNLPTRAAVGPLFHQLGTPAWNMMLRRVNLLFERETNSHAGNGTFIDPPGAVTVFARELGQFLARQETNRNYWEVTLVGHSMGAIVAAEFLERAQIYSDFPRVDNIVLMAPAVSQRGFENAVLPYMAQHTNTLCSVLTLERRGDLWERAAHGLAPQGSLLLWVDDYFATPNSEVDQTLGRFPNLMLAAHRIPPDLRKRMNFRVFPHGDEELLETPLKHGDFSRTRFWRREFWDVRANDEH